MHLKHTQTTLINVQRTYPFKHPFSKTPETHNMSTFQQSALINFFNESNTSLVKALAEKYGFDAADALAYINGISPSPTKAKKVKDPNAPKRSPTAFFLFSKHYRTENADDIAGKKASDVAKLAGAAWSEIKETDAAEPFHTKAAELKASSVSIVQKKVKDPTARKRPLSAFFLFSKQYRVDNADDIAGKKGSDVAKLIGAAWNEIKETDVAEPYHTKAAELKAASALAVPKSGVISDGSSTAEPILSNDE